MIEVIEKANKDTATNKITAQSARIAQALVTNRLRGQFAIQVNKLGVAELAIELQQAKTSAGVPFFQVRLINKPSEPVGKVLSEGEHRGARRFHSPAFDYRRQSAIVPRTVRAYLDSQNLYAIDAGTSAGLNIVNSV